MKRSIVLVASLLLWPNSAAAQALEGFERVLLPVYSGPMKGAGDVEYSTGKVQVYSERSFRFWPNSANDGTKQFGVYSGRSELGSLGIKATGPVSPALFYVEKEAATGAVFELNGYAVRTADERRPAVISIPVVREKDFITGRSHILAVPFHYWSLPYSSDPAPGSPEESFRHHVRIYDVDLRGDMEVTVTVHSRIVTLMFVDTYVVRLNARSGNDANAPYYGELYLPPRCVTNYFQRVQCASYDALVELTPSNPTARYWAMISSTNNRTHEFAIKLPHALGPP